MVGAAMSQFPVEFVVNSALCLLHLIIGIAIGWRLGRWSIGAALRVPDRSHGIWATTTVDQDLRLERHDHLSHTDEDLALPARQDQAAASLVAEEESEALSTIVNHWKVLPICAPAPTDNLAARRTTTAASEWEHGVNQREREREDDVMTNSEIVDLCDILRQNDRPEEEQPIRYRLSAKQVLAPFPFAGVESFRLVQCHDLSVREIRFFVDDPPTEDTIIVGLGLPSPVKWVVADIEDARAVFMYGRMGMLVTARLIRIIELPGRTASFASATK
jgi:hypothetical protein